MTVNKRIFDIVGTVLIFAVLWPLLLFFIILLLVKEGRPLFHLSERMRGPDESFTLIKLRTMRPAEGPDGVTGGDDTGRISPVQALARRWHADELPQLWNVLAGDISLIGPRPPIRRYVELYPALYARVLQSRPGLTGLATLTFGRHEEAILRRAGSAAETDALYRRRCVARKARIDLIYQQHRTVWWDFALAYRTLGHMGGGKSRRPRPRPAGRLAPLQAQEP